MPVRFLSALPDGLLLRIAPGFCIEVTLRLDFEEEDFIFFLAIVYGKNEVN